MKSVHVPYPKLSVPYATASGLYSAHLLLWAPGTVASMTATIFGLFLVGYLSVFSLFLGSVIWFFLGWWSIQKIESHISSQFHDASIFVADEWCGQWLVLAATFYIFSEQHLWYCAVAGFLSFRFFDILKPWPIRWFDTQISGGFGVMIDDVVAALMAIALLFGVNLLLV